MDMTHQGNCHLSSAAIVGGPQGYCAHCLLSTSPSGCNSVVKRMEYQISRGATAGSDVNERELTNQISCVVRSLSSFH